MGGGKVGLDKPGFSTSRFRIPGFGKTGIKPVYRNGFQPKFGKKPGYRFRGLSNPTIYAGKLKCNFLGKQLLLS